MYCRHVELVQQMLKAIVGAREPCCGSEEILGTG